MLYIGGPLELSKKNKPMPDKKLKPVIEAYKLLNLSVAYMTPVEYQAMQTAGIAVPKSWVDVQGLASKIITTSKGQKIGFIFFPMLKKGVVTPPPDMFMNIDKQVEKLKPETDLVIGLSPWGYMPESGYMATAKNPVDILLGSGPGLGLAGRAQRQGESYWTRSYSKGKAVIELILFSLPGHNKAHWKMKKNIESKIVSLLQKFQPDPKVEQLIKDIEDEK